MPAVTRELSVIYGTITLGGTTDRIIDGPWSYDPRYPTASFECEFQAFAATEAAFTTETAALEAGLRTPRQRLRVVLGAVTTIDLNPATNSGFNARTSLSRLASDDHTGRSARYKFRVEVDLPADLAGQSGRFDEAVAVAYAPGGRRTVTLRGQYRALTTNDATAQYAAQIAGHQSTVLTAIDAAATWELISATTSRDDTDKILTYDRTISEILLAQSSAAVDDPNLFDQQLAVRIGRVAPGDDPDAGASRLVAVEVSYSAAVLSTVTDLPALWTGTIRPWIVQHARTVGAITGLAVLSDQPSFDSGARRITASLSMVGQGVSAVVEALRTVEDAVDLGAEFLPTWEEDALSAHVFHGPEVAIRTITIHRVTIGPPDATVPRTIERFVTEAGQTSDLYESAGEVQVRMTGRTVRVLLGLPGEQLEITTRDETRVTRLVHAPALVGSDDLGPDGGVHTITGR